MSDKSGLNSSGVNLAEYLSSDKKNKSWADQTIEETQEPAQKPKKSAWGTVAPPKLDQEIQWPTPAPSQQEAPREREQRGPRDYDDRPPRDYDGGRRGGYGGGRYGDREDRGDRPPRDYDGGRRGGYGGDREDRGERGGYRGRGRGGYRGGYGDREERGDRPPRDYEGGRRYGDRPPRDYEGRRGERGDREDRERDNSEERSPVRPPVNLPTNPPYTAFIGNLPFSLTEEDIAAFFRGTDIKSIRLPADKDGKLRGYGYVEFEDVESLEKALRSTGRFILDRKVRVDVATERKQEDRPPRRERPERSDRDNGPANWRSEPKDTDPRDGHQSPPRERKRLDLKPRTAPISGPASTGGANKPKEDIFGGATLSVEKQKKREEELAAKLAQSRDYAEKKAREDRERENNREERGTWSNNRGGRGGRGGRQQHSDRNGNDGEFRSQNRARTSSQSEKRDRDNTNTKKKGNDDTVENRFAALTVQGGDDADE